MLSPFNKVKVTKLRVGRVKVKKLRVEKVKVMKREVVLETRDYKINCCVFGFH